MDKLANTLIHHLSEVREGKRVFENAFQAFTRMVLDGENRIETVTVAGKPALDYKIFREGKKPLVGMHDELNSLVTFVHEAAQGGSAKEMAIVFVGEPGNGKTYLAETCCQLFRDFHRQEKNRKYTFCFKNLGALETYGKIREIESQTFEDPMILTMNLFESKEENIQFLLRQGFNEEQIEKMYNNYRPLGACSDYIFREIKEKMGGNGSADLEQILNDFIKIKPVVISDTQGTLTGKYPAKDKITSSSVDLLGARDITVAFQLDDRNNPYRYDVRAGALGRSAGGGIHFSDELFKNKIDLIQIYLQVIQNRTIDHNGCIWPMDTLIIATSNNEEFNRFKNQEGQKPSTDRCSIVYMSHNTNYKLQESLTKYAVGSQEKSTMFGDKLHYDPNFNYASSVAAVMTRLPLSEKLERIETLKLAAGERASDKSLKTLAEVVETLSQNPDITHRFGQRGLGQRDLNRSVLIQTESVETQQNKCMFAGDVFKAYERVVLDCVTDDNDRKKYLDDLKAAREFYKQKVKEDIFNAYRGNSEAVKEDVLTYVYMVVGFDDKKNDNSLWTYTEPVTGNLRTIKIDQKYMDKVEERMGLKNEEAKKSYRAQISKVFAQKGAIGQPYDFMDDERLKSAVTDVRINSDIHGEGSLMGALMNRTKKENQEIYDRMIKIMRGSNFCESCACRTIELYCSKD
ncbi:MAG: serine protein kinase PrkA [Nanoarchaeota archaeon]